MKQATLTMTPPQRAICEQLLAAARDRAIHGRAEEDVML